jgi:TolB-like protein
MSEIFISYARPNEADARRIAEALRTRGWGVWRDDELPPHRAYAEVIEERLRSAKAVVVVWTADAAKSQWVRAEADIGRERGTLVQLTLDGAIPPLPFNQIQCADLQGWQGEDGHPAWRKILTSVSDLVGAEAGSPGPAAVQPETHALPQEKPVVTVRPLAMVSGQDAEGLAAGLTEEVRNALAGHTTIALGAGLKPSRADDYVLEGSVQQAGERIRVSAKLMGSDGSQVWTDRFDGTRADLFEFQDRVALAVSGGVEGAIRTFEADRAVSGAEHELNARQLFYRAVKQVRRWDREGMTDALRLMERVLELRPDHLHALASAATICANVRGLGFYEEGEEQVLIRKGMDYARRALQLTDADPYATGLAAYALANFGDAMDAMVSLLERVLKLTPSFAFAWMWGGSAQLMAGDVEAAIDRLRRSLELDPRIAARAVCLFQLGAAYILLERYEEARAVLVESVQIRSHVPVSRVLLAICLARMDRMDEAKAALAAAQSLTPVSRIRQTFRDPDQRRRLREGLALVGFDKPELVFPDV